MSRALLASLALAVYALSLAIHVPARFVLGFQSTGLERYVREPEDGLWHGNGLLYLQSEPVGRLVWWIEPLASLASGCWQIAAKLDTRGAAKLEICGQQWSVRDLALRLDAAGVAPHLGLPVSSASGTLEAQIDWLEVHPSRLGAKGEIRWRQAAAGLGVKIPLGTVLMSVSPERQHIRVDVRNEAGNLGLELMAVLDRQLNYQLSGTLGAVSGGPSLDQFGIIGERAPNGSYRVRHAGNFSR